ncbi:MAG TPA: hypothetical protein VNZ86_11630 [Bacteroidia bacterium]|jgi:hypothetical protein|nr:hypothetical protein [Bacteroidia bacterium]
MIRYVTHSEIDPHKWDSCIQRSVNGMIYAYSWYLDIVSPGWEGLVEEDYQSVMPLPCRKKYGIHYLYPPFFTQQLGVFSVNKFTEEKIREFIGAIPKRYKYYEINLNTLNKFSSMDVIIHPNLTHELDLIQSYPEIHNAYSENLRRNLKKAGNSDLVVDKNVSPQLVINLFRHNKGRQYSQISPRDYDTLEILIQTCLQKGRAQVWGVLSKERRLCAGAFFVESNGKVIFLFSGANQVALTNGAMPYLIDRFIEENAHRNLILDFEGSNDLNLARFYKSFGSKECVYLQVKVNRLPWYARYFKE